MKYILKFQSDGNLVLYNVSSGKALWSSKTSGNSNAVLSIQGDGNVVIYKDNTQKVPLWSSGTFGFNKTTVMVVDNNGYVVVFGYDNTMKLRWSSAPKSEYYLLNSGLQLSKLSNDPLSFTRPCTDAKYDQKLDNSAILEAQAAWCGSGLNILDDRCSKFVVGGIVDGDNSSQDIKKKYIDTYVQTLVCSDGYDSRYPKDKKLQAKINSLCSCVNPVGDSLSLLKSGVYPKCYGQTCVENGYKTIASESIQCPKCLCVQSMNLKNLQLASNVQQTCSANCTNIGKSIDVIATTTNNSIDTSISSNTPTGSSNTSTTVNTSTAVNTSTIAPSTDLTAINTASVSITPSTDSTAINTSSTTPSDDSAVVNTSSTASSTNSSTTSLEIIGIILGIIAVLLLGVFLIYILRKKKKIPVPQPQIPVPQPQIPVPQPH